MRFSLLGSGSKGNATLIEAGSTRLLVDSGFSLKQLERRLLERGCDPSSLSGIVVTHEHHDHIGGVGPLARKHQLPVMMTHGSWKASAKRVGELPALTLFNCHQPFSLGELEIEPFPVPHDALEPSQFLFRDGCSTLGLLTDVGHVTPHIRQQLDGCDALIIECNHDEQMLEEGPYHSNLKQRVAGALGHLSNRQAHRLLSELDTGKLQHIVAAHLSDTNNLPVLAQRAIADALGCSEEWIALADQDHGLGWRVVI